MNANIGNKTSLYSFLFSELQSSIKPSFRAKQIFDWLYNKYTLDIDSMSNLSLNTKDELKNRFFISNLTLLKKEESTDGTKKYLFKTKEGFSFESVFIKMKDKKIDENKKVIENEKYTFCLSSQIGCQVGCKFCYTAKAGFMRDLSEAEIVEQVVFLKRDNNLDSNKSVNIVFMGMGEPLLNLKNVSRAIKIISDPQGLAISTKRQTISTSGIASKIKELGDLNLGVQIAISLHAVNDTIRDKIMPINKIYNIKSVLDALREFPLEKRNKIMFEYLAIKDTNDSIENAKSLVKLLHGFRAKVNLIPFNPHEGSEFKRPEMNNLKIFADFLYKKGIVATIRYSKGQDISAACGQLHAKNKKLEKVK